MAYRPRIGLTMRYEIDTRRFYLGRDYSDALHAKGGLPVLIPLTPDREFIAGVVAGLDGILLPGSDTDVDPAYFGEDPHPRLGTVIPEKDQTDLFVLAEVERLNLPLLAICYGMQALSVSRNGTLIQDIESQIDEALQHRQGKPIERDSHSIRIDDDSILAELVNEGNWLENVKVNSHHHQAIRVPGENLRAIAWANDGVVEGIQDTRPDRFVLGVQWHPELSWKTDDLSSAIFKTFVSRCAERMESRVLSDVNTGVSV